ncbi:hypothetical protein K523DRAFT_403428 [Schizophyllum commune Tattone D]|nr:hypothetical protein K523DRAFT_403428 [Schizophyllum commune Tattone D]
MALPGPHHRFISRLRKLQESNLPPLPTRKMAADFRRQTNAQLAALRQMVPRDAIGRQPRQQQPRHRGGAGPAPDTPASQDGLLKTDAASRIAAILERPAQELDVSEVWRMATDPPEPVSRAEAEDDAISRLLRGIEQRSSMVWRNSSPLDYNTLSAASYSQQQTVAREADEGVRLVRLHNRIHVASVRHDLDNLRERLQLIADTVEFGLLWLSLGGDRGGRCPAKSEFYKSVYFSQNPDAYVTRLDKQDVELNPDFLHWKESVMRPIVTGRNRLVQLYKKAIWAPPSPRSLLVGQGPAPEQPDSRVHRDLPPTASDRTQPGL